MHAVDVHAMPTTVIDSPVAALVDVYANVVVHTRSQAMFAAVFAERCDVLMHGMFNARASVPASGLIHAMTGCARISAIFALAQ